MSNYEGFSAGDFGESMKKRLPICFCLDTSGSMEAPTATGRTRIEELNEAFSEFIYQMRSNEDVASSADIAIVTFGGTAEIVKPFSQLSTTNDIPRIQAKHRSLTPMGEAILIALKLLEIRKAGYKDIGMKYFQPWLVVVTDGEPEGKDAKPNMEIAIRQVLELERNNKLVVFNVGIGEDAGMEVLRRLSIKRDAPISISETNLSDLFRFLGASSDTIISGGNEDEILYGGDIMPKGKEIDISEWCV